MMPDTNGIFQDEASSAEIALKRQDKRRNLTISFQKWSKVDTRKQLAKFQGAGAPGSSTKKFRLLACPPAP